ncbi:MAG TPA: TonB-dependent receptor [Chryseosolibacter sp.]|nr:TonB-dependent receptor [Chryseosolibacter sp.]
MKKVLLLMLVFVLAFAPPMLAQERAVTGVVNDKSDGSPVAGVSVVVKGTSSGTITDSDGRFSLQVPPSATTLVFSFVGYSTQEVPIPASNTVTVNLVSNVSELGEVIVVGTRGSQRTITDTPLPVDVLSATELKTTGQYTFDKALQYRVPSFNTVQTPVNDATSLLDPYEIRNMGPSRTLILINGKRKNFSSLIYTQTSPGRGESGVDISAIPTDAVKRVEILRDGASAQYGSDAIAGVMNIILKDNAEEGTVTVRTGVTGEGDGGLMAIAVNNGAKLFNTGFINYTIDFSKVGLANRPGTVDAEGEASDFGANIADVQAFLAAKPDAGNINGSPETTAAKFLVNGGADVSENNNLYFNAAYVYKKVNSFANYRTPYWRTLADYPYLQDFFPDKNGNYMGYVPTFDGDLNDYNGTVGLRSKKNGWNTDLSLTVGGNQQLYTVRNSHNRNTLELRNPDVYLGDLDNDGVVDANEIQQGTLKYRENSPITFRAGGARFNHIVGNMDVSRLLAENLTVAFGSEFRSETFETIEGDVASYEAGGADSFAGNTKENSFKSNRYNFGGYLSFGYDITEDFLIDLTGRFENYSDFGDAFVYKVSSRYKFAGDKMTLRGSYSTGFRAPSLHQIYTQKAQYSFVPGQGIQVSGLANNVSPQIRLLQIPRLDAEKSNNLTVGLGVNLTENFTFTVDYYNITVKDRIVLSNEIGPTGNPAATLDQILNDNGIVSLSFFTNSLDTKTSGLDVVANYRNLSAGPGELSFNLAGNYQIQNERDGAVKNPGIIASAGQSVIDATQEALIFTSRPKYKAILGVDYSLKKFMFTLNNTLFGPTEFRNAGMDSNLKIEFEPKIVTDIGINYSASEKVTVAFNVNNVLDVLPEWKFVALNPTGESILSNPAQRKVQSNLITFNQRYSTMTYDGYHFSQLGTIYNLSVAVRF